MWWAWAEPLDVYVGTRAVAACRGKEVLWSAQVVNLDGALSELKAQLVLQRPRGALRIWLSGGLCRPFVVPAIAGVRSRHERAKAAAAMAPNLTGLEGPCRVWLQRERLDKPAVGVALLETTLQGLLAAAKPTAAEPRRIGLIRPWWSELLRHCLQSHQMLRCVGVQDCDSLTILSGEGEEFTLATTLSPVADPQSADAAFARALMAAGLDPSESRFGRLLPSAGPENSSTDGIALGSLLEPVR